jgi:hypothetical protein
MCRAAKVLLLAFGDPSLFLLTARKLSVVADLPLPIRHAALRLTL